MMATPSFLGIALEIREQIYDSLLTFQPTSSTTTTAPCSPLCTLLTLNRQIFAEIQHFFRSQLLVLVKTNDSEFLENVLEEVPSDVTPFLSQLRSKDGNVTKSASTGKYLPVALELDFYMFHNNLDAESHPVFLMPAKSVGTLLRALWLPKFYIWTQQASLSFHILDRFDFEHKEVEDRLIRPWINAFMPPTFVGITIGDSPITISTEVVSQLKNRLTGSYEARGHLQKLDSLIRGAVKQCESSDFAAAAERFTMCGRYAEILWSCHLDCMSDAANRFDALNDLWLMTCQIGADHAQILLNVATGGPTPSIPIGTIGSSDKRFTQSRSVAERAIKALRSRATWSCEKTADMPQGRTAVRRSKAKMSFRAHAACRGMGDVDAAVGYLREALKYEPETSAKLIARIEDLKMAGAKEEGKVEGVVRWEED